MSDIAGAPTGAAPHALDVDGVLRAFATSAAGLTGSAARRRLAEFGANELAARSRVPAWRRFARHLREPLVLLLLAAAGLALALGDSLDAAAILAIVLSNAILAFGQEERAQRALASLRGLMRPVARVLRDGAVDELPAAALVPGDVVQLEAGDLVPADVRLIASSACRTQEASLTGESLPLDKRADAVLPASTPLAERVNLAFAGTVVVAGNARGVVVATGMRTEIGRIAGMLRAIEPRPTPLQRRLGRLGRTLAVACVAIAAALAVWYWLEGESLAAVLLRSIGLAVAAVPEGLPAVVAIALALGMRRLVDVNALMRHMRSVETLGSVDVICTDKTGTLTRNEMAVLEVWTSASAFAVVGQAGSRRWVRDGSAADAAADPDFVRVLEIGVACNNARLGPGEAVDAPWRVIGDPTEGALLLAAADAGLPTALPPASRVGFELPFDSERRRMSVAVEAAGRFAVYTKGAPEAVLPRCVAVLAAGRIEPLSAAVRERLLTRAAELGARGLRVLALAFRDGPATPEDAERELVFAGLVGMRDPPRARVPDAIASCRRAGIRTVMVTGDQPATALAIAREIGLAGSDDAATTGAELDACDDAQLADRAARCPVFARTTAAHKLRLVRALQAAGHTVAMTGDGVNDAPALGEADIGVAMGRTGTDVTRHAADLVLLDDDFATIVDAVREGRGIFDNIQRFVHYLLATNVAEVQIVVLAAVIGWPAPLSALQLLWINLVTDGLPALALGMEPVAADVLMRQPRRPDAGIVTRQDWIRIAVCGALVCAAGAAVFGWHLAGGVAHAGTMAMVTLVHAQLALAFAFRSRTRTLFQLGPASNPQLVACVGAATLLQVLVVLVPELRGVFGLSAVGLGEWALAAAIGLLPVTVLELAKLRR